MNAAFRGSWGNRAVEPPRAALARDWRFEELPSAAPGGMLAAGMGRSYGDVGLNSGGTSLSTRALDRFLSFDTASGRLECEAGVTIGEVLRVVVPRGWYLPVVPGTQWVTLGGAVANDIHGKNHARAGSLGCHVLELELLRSDRGRVLCSAQHEADLFRATIGGIGLTGLITRVAVQLRAVPGARMRVEELPFASLAELQQRIEQSASWEYSVAWIDSSRLGNGGCRGVLGRAEHIAGAAKESPAQANVPLTPPFSLVGDMSAWGFSRMVAALQRTPRERELDHRAYFFPLDALGHWSRLYGTRGLYQYQCVVPAADAVREILATVHALGPVSPLIVLKDFGPIRSPGLLSFPRPGLTLAMDFPADGARVHTLFARLDAIVREHGGALYPAKDARMDRAMFESSFPALGQFLTLIDPAFSSNFWRRVQ